MSQQKQTTYTWQVRKWSVGYKEGKKYFTMVIVIPRWVRKKLNLKPGDVVQITIKKVE